MIEALLWPFDWLCDTVFKFWFEPRKKLALELIGDDWFEPRDLVAKSEGKFSDGAAIVILHELRREGILESRAEMWFPREQRIRKGAIRLYRRRP